VQLKAKEWIKKQGVDFEIIITCEALILNYLNWRIPLVSISDIIEKNFEYLQLRAELKNSLSSNVEDYVNFAISELKIYSQFNYITIAFVICKINLKFITDPRYSQSLDALIAKLDLSNDVRICGQFFFRELNTEEEKETL
jgi:hypothetical protein